MSKTGLVVIILYTTEKTTIYHNQLSSTSVTN